MYLLLQFPDHTVSLSKFRVGTEDGNLEAGAEMEVMEDVARWLSPYGFLNLVS